MTLRTCLLLNPLEARETPSATGGTGFTGGVYVGGGRFTSTADAPDRIQTTAGGQAVTGRITGVVADPSPSLGVQFTGGVRVASADVGGDN